jgi:hypothetical protein
MNARVRQAKSSMRCACTYKLIIWLHACMHVCLGLLVCARGIACRRGAAASIVCATIRQGTTRFLPRSVEAPRLQARMLTRFNKKLTVHAASQRLTWFVVLDASEQSFDVAVPCGPLASLFFCLRFAVVLVDHCFIICHIYTFYF